jgi:phosphohistidine phosphatase SixA
MLPSTAARADEVAAWAALKAGAIVLFRHANAPGTGDPPNMRLDDCSTQRNLDTGGRAQAARIGEAFRARAIPVGAVWTSRWCRARDTASLAFPGLVTDQPAFDSFFDNRADGPAQTRAALAKLKAWQGPGSLVVTTHQVNITALTDIFPASGEGIVVRVQDGALEVIGRVKP